MTIAAGRAALLLIDVINDLKFEGSGRLLEHALRLVVPSDCIASNTVEENEYALTQMRTVLKADIRPSDTQAFDKKPRGLTSVIPAAGAAGSRASRRQTTPGTGARRPRETLRRRARGWRSHGRCRRC